MQPWFDDPDQGAPLIQGEIGMPEKPPTLEILRITTPIQ